MGLRKRSTLAALATILLLTNHVAAEHNTIDSLRACLEQTDNIQQRAEIYFRLASASRNVNPYTGLDYADSAIVLSRRLKDLSLEAQIINETGVLYHKVDMYEMAVMQHQKALQMFEQLHDTMGVAFSYANLGNIFLSLQDYQKAKRYHLDALRLKLALGDSLQIAYSYRCTALSYQAMNQPDSTLLLLNEALAIYKSKNDDLKQANIYYLLGNLLLETNQDSDLALHYYARSLDIYSSFHSEYGSARSMYEIGRAYARLGRNDLAKKHYKAALLMAQNAGIRNTVMDVYLALSLLSSDAGDYRGAFTYFRDYAAIRDSLFSETTEKNIAEMQLKYKNTKQQNEILFLRQQNQLLHKEQKLNNAYLFIMVIGILSVFIIGIISYARYSQNKQINQQLQAEVQQRKENELKLQVSQKELQHANATKDKFISIISHDLKSPFSGIMGFAELLETEYDILTDEVRKEMVTEIRKASDNTFQLLEELLTWSRSRRGLISYEPNAVNVANLCQHTLEITTPAAHKKQVGLVLNADENIFIYADRNMIQTVLRNLLSNAIKFSNKGGKIVLAAKQIYNGDDKNLLAKTIEISVTDSGVGIRSEDISRLFRIEEKLNTYGTANETGTGLGLIICKEFVETHGGTISAYSTEGEGSTFYFRIPAAKSVALVTEPLQA